MRVSPLLRNSLLRSLTCAICATLSLQPTTVSAQGNQPSNEAVVTVSFIPGHAANRFIPSRALGAGVDGHSIGETVRQLSPANIKAMLSAGPRPLTYPLKNEPPGETRPWNSNGSGSDPGPGRGYCDPT